MQAELDFLRAQGHLLLTPVIILAVTLAVGAIVRRSVFKALRSWSARTGPWIDDLIVESLYGPFLIWVLMLGVYLATHFSVLPERAVDFAGKLLLILFIVSITVVASRMVGTLIRQWGTTAASAVQVTSLSQNLARVVIISLGALLVLNILGVSVTPILTALGVGGLAVALALQDTLSNLFAGFYVSLAGQVRLGDYIKLDSGEEGYVTDISWRSTAIRSLPNNLIIIPNSKLAQAIVTNYHLPEKRMSLLIPIGVSYDSDPEAIERILVEEAKSAAKEIPGLLAEPAPFVRFIPGFGDSSLNFTLICQVAEFVDQYLVQHELRKRIFNRFRQTGVEIPFPIRTVYLHDPAGKIRSTGREAAAGGTS